MTTNVNTVSASEALADYRRRAANNRLGLWIFILSEVFLFGGILISRFILWGDTKPELEQLPAFLLTAVLLASSYFMYRAETSIQFGDRKGFLNGIILTAVLGTTFLLGVIFYEWPSSHLTVYDNVYGAVFYLMTGMHAFHVLTGVLFLGIIYRNGRKGVYTPEKYWPVEAAAIYWHFVDIVWFFFYPALYLIGATVG